MTSDKVSTQEPLLPGEPSPHTEGPLHDDGITAKDEARVELSVTSEPTEVAAPRLDSDIVEPEVAADPEPVVAPEPALVEPVAPAVAAPEPLSTPQPQTTVIQKRGSVVPGLIGGLIAAACGFGLAQVVPQGWPIGQDKAALQAMETRLAAFESRPISGDLEGRLSALESATPEVEALRAQIAALGQNDRSAEIEALKSELATLRSELASLPQNQTAEEIAALKASIEEERAATQAKAEALRAEAEQTARRAVAQAAALRVQAALDSGADFAPALADLQSAGVSLPADLAANAEGVTPLSRLQDDFPDIARATLAALATPGPEASLTERFSAFVKVQTGLRSLTPQEGNSPDAILSRAEAKVAEGDLKGALAELDALPAEAAPVLAPWRDKAEARVNLGEALSALTTQINAEKN